MKIRLSGATFDASGKTIVHADFSDVTLAGIQLITNVTDNIIIYNFADPTKGGSLATDTLTLDYDTTTMDDADILQILVEDGLDTINVIPPAITSDAGVVEANTPRMTLASDDPAVALLTTIEANQLADSHNVTVDNASLAVTGTFWQATQPVSGTVAATQSGTWDEVGINDSGNSITVDNAVISVVGGGTEATAQRVTIANDSTGVLSIDDNGGVITVDGTVAVTHAALTELAAAINSDKVDVNIVSGASSGTQYTDGDVDATPTGTLAMFRNSGDDTVQAVADNSPLPVDVITIGVVNVEQATAANLNVTEASAAGILTSVQTLDNAIAGSEMQVDVITMPTTAVTNAGLTELAAAINGSSQMDVNIAASGIALGGTSAADDADFTAGTTAGTPAMGVYDSTPDAVTDGDLGTIGINVNRAVRTVIEAGSAAIGKLAANTGVDIGDVDVTSSALPTGAATSANQTTIIGHVDGLEGLIGTTNTNTGNIVTSVQLIDDTVTTLGTDTYTEATSKGITLGAVRRDADTTLVNTTNEFTPLQVDANGRLKVEAFSGEALPVTLTSTTVTGTVAVTQSGTWDEVGINDSGNSITVDGTVAVTGVSTLAEQQTQTTHLATIAGDTTSIQTAVEILDNAISGSEMQVDVVAALPAGTNNIGDVDIVSGTITTVSTVTALGAGTTGPMKAEDVGHTTGDQGFPAWGVRNDTMADTSSTDADYSQVSTDLKGRVITTNAPRARKLHQITTITASTSETTILTAAASTFHDVYGIMVTNTSATATEIHVKDDTAGTTRFTLSCPANDTRGFMLPIDAAINASATNDNWTATAVDSVTSLIITVFAVKNL